MYSLSLTKKLFDISNSFLHDSQICKGKKYIYKSVIYIKYIVISIYIDRYSSSYIIVIYIIYIVISIYIDIVLPI